MTGYLCLPIVLVGLSVSASQADLPSDLPDFSWAGYHAGEKEIPQREATIDVKALGAKGDGKTDDTEALKKALAEAAKTQGVVAVPEGRYVLTDVLEIRTSGVVLRGAGSGKTTLVCPHPLATIRGPSRGWSWSGGMILVEPKRGPAAKVATVIREAKAQSDRLEVEVQRSAELKAGEWLELVWHNDTGKDTLLDHLYGGVIPSNRMGPELQKSKGARVREWVCLNAVDGQQLTLGQPLRIDARPEWKPTLFRRPAIQEVGVEGLTFEFPLTKYPGHLREKGYNGIYVQAAINCWVRDVKTINADSGIFVNGSRYVTVQDVVIQGRMMHHCISASWSSDCLFTRWRIEAPHVHGTTISWAAHGNVYSQGWGRQLATDSHRAASFQNLHTTITIDHGGGVVNPFRSGGSGPRGPQAAKQNVYWNVINNFSGTAKGRAQIRGFHEWPLGIFVGWHGSRPLRMDPTKGMKQRILLLNDKPEIEDLHQYQRARRLGERSSEN